MTFSPFRLKITTMKKDRKRKLPRIVAVLLTIVVILVSIPLLLAGISLFGRIPVDSVFPDDYMAYADIPNPVRAASRIMKHRGIDSLLADPVFTPVAPTVSLLQETSLLDNPLVHIALNNPLTGALYQDSTILLCYDTGFLSALTRFTPLLVSRMKIPELYYVQAGNHSRFEFRQDEITSFYAGFHHNLLVISNNRTLFESIFDKPELPNEETVNSEKVFESKSHDMAVLINSRSFFSTFAPEDTEIRSVLETLEMPRLAEAAFSVETDKIDIRVSIPLSSTTKEIQQILSKRSPVPSILEYLPLTTQYATMISAGSLEELIDMARVVQGRSFAKLLDTAESSSKMLVGLPLSDLLYSWTGGEFAVFGLEGQPNPVFAVNVSDEQQRRTVFSKLTSSFALTQDDSVVLEGVRIPSIRIPSFLLSILSIWDITIQSQYYLVENDVLYFSQSPENLLDTVRSIRNNTTLIRQDDWRQLASGTDDRSSVALFYSLDRSIPFFLRGNSDFQRILKLYGRGLGRIQFQEDTTILSLSILSGEPTGILPVPGYPVDIGQKVGNKVSVLEFGKKNEKRIILTLGDSSVLALDPRTGKRYTLTEDSAIWVLPDPSMKPEKPEDPALWVITARGRISLVNGNLETVPGFPVSTGARLSSEPAAYGERIYLPDQDTSLYVVSRNGDLEVLSMPFSEVLRSPPVFFPLGKKTYMGAYPKGFFAELWLTSDSGTPEPGWPVSVSGIAFGSPVLFQDQNELYVAFITQAGDLTIFTERGSLKAGYPITLPGVFYTQPVFCGEYLWALSAGGRLYRISLDGSVTSKEVPFTAENAVVQAYDTTGDGKAEIFVSGDGNAIYGFTAMLEPLEDFPLPAWGTPWFGDINGDGTINCFAVGMDSRLYAWQLR